MRDRLAGLFRKRTSVSPDRSNSLANRSPASSPRLDEVKPPSELPPAPATTTTDPVPNLDSTDLALPTQLGVEAAGNIVAPITLPVVDGQVDLPVADGLAKSSIMTDESVAIDDDQSNHVSQTSHVDLDHKPIMALADNLVVDEGANPSGPAIDSQPVGHSDHKPGGPNGTTSYASEPGPALEVTKADIVPVDDEPIVDDKADELVADGQLPNGTSSDASEPGPALEDMKADIVPVDDEPIVDDKADELVADGQLPNGTSSDASEPGPALEDMKADIVPVDDEPIVDDKADELVADGKLNEHAGATTSIDSRAQESTMAGAVNGHNDPKA